MTADIYDDLVQRGHGMVTFGRGLGVMYGIDNADCPKGWLFIPNTTTSTLRIRELVRDYKVEAKLS